MNPITGSLVALVTPMHDDGSLDFAALRRLVDWHIAEGTSCIVAVGTTGESPTLSHEEREEVNIVHTIAKISAARTVIKHKSSKTTMMHRE